MEILVTQPPNGCIRVSQYNRVMSPSDAVDLDLLLVYAFVFFWN